MAKMTPDNSLPTLAARGLDAGKEYDTTYQRFYALAVQAGMPDQAARVYAEGQASALHAAPQSRTEGASAADMPLDPEFGSSGMTPDVKRRFHERGLPTETVPGPRMANGLPPSKPVPFAPNQQGLDAAKGYVERQGLVEPGGVRAYKPSQRDLDMSARGMVPVYRDDGSVGYAPGMLEEPASPDSPANYRGGTGRAGRRIDLERKGWRLVAEEGPTGRVYVYRMQPPEAPIGDPGGALQKLPASPERLSPAAFTGTDYKGREIMSMPGRPGMPSMVEPDGNTFERSQAFRARQRDKARAARAGIDPIEAATMSEDEVLRRGDRARNAGEASAREQITLQTRRLGYATPATMAEAALIYQMTPEQRARLAAFQAAGGRGATPNDMATAEAVARNRPRSAQEILAEAQKTQAEATKAADERADAQRKHALSDEELFREYPANDPVVIKRARGLLSATGWGGTEHNRWIAARGKLRDAGYTAEEIASLIGPEPPTDRPSPPASKLPVPTSPGSYSGEM